MKKIYTIIASICLLLSSSTYAQVTIGSGLAPNKGAALDLKEKANGTSTKGFILPRVKLTDVDKLKIGDADELLGGELAKHAGLAVYNVSGEANPKCAPIPNGLYVWDGGMWNGINTPKKPDPITLNIGNTTDFYFPSGTSWQPMPTVPATFNVSWSPANPLHYTNTAHATFGGVVFSGANALPSTPLAASPVAFNLLPEAMTAAEITANPFRTRESILAFNATNECETTTKSITVNQTNKALTLATTSYENPTNGAVYDNTLQSNTKWQLASMEPNDATSVFSGIKIGSAPLAIGTAIDWEQNNNAGQGATNNLSYTITTGATKSRYSRLTFSDTENPKRFEDVTLSVLQCSNVGINPRMSEWAAIAGFADVAEIKISDAHDIAKKIDTPNTTTGIAWHRDQDGNIFLSSSFHPTQITSNTERWMITNLAATNFVANADRTGDDNLVLAPTFMAHTGANGWGSCIWGYPSNIPKPDNELQMDATNPTNYINNPRLGRLYNWAAATNSRGGAGDGTGIVNDGEDQGMSNAKRQGICPSGWRLPNDWEWTALEREINSNTTTYSSQAANINSTIVTGATGFRGTRHGKAMKESCEPYTLTHQGTSNPIGTTVRPSLEILLPGALNANATTAANYGNVTAFWSASGAGQYNAASRTYHKDESRVGRSNFARYGAYSVRCKKN